MATIEVSVFTLHGVNIRDRWNSKHRPGTPEPSTEELLTALDTTYEKVRAMLIARMERE